MPDAPLKLRVHDTLSRRKVGVKPSPGKGGRSVRLYVCGITPYDAGHMGHAFTFCAYDVLIRFIESSGVRVRYVQNITDVDDPLFERARRDRVDWRDLADKETAIHLRDMDALGWRRPDFLPRVSDEIKPILSAAGKLYAAGYGYQTDAVYFDASKYRGYGRLSRRTRRSMIRKLRHEDLLGMVGPGAKRDALDFPLWRGSAPDEPAWPSQFGPGRPGWHIECTAMSMHYLGEQIDIHGGGRDLAFSHHESERAQSESLTGKVPFARIWMHAGLVRYEGRKMSKSLGNLVYVSQALERAPAAGCGSIWPHIGMGVIGSSTGRGWRERPGWLRACARCWKVSRRGWDRLNPQNREGWDPKKVCRSAGGGSWPGSTTPSPTTSTPRPRFGYCAKPSAGARPKQPATCSGSWPEPPRSARTGR